MATLSTEKTDKYDKILLEKDGMLTELKSGGLSKKERIELKSHAIKKAIKIKRYVRN